MLVGRFKETEAAERIPETPRRNRGMRVGPTQRAAHKGAIGQEAVGANALRLAHV